MRKPGASSAPPGMLKMPTREEAAEAKSPSISQPALSAGGGGVFPNRAIASASAIDSDLQVITVLGYAVEGDARPHSYQRITDPGGTLPAWQFRDSAAVPGCWQLFEQEISPEYLGAIRDMSEYQLTSVSGYVDQVTF